MTVVDIWITSLFLYFYKKIKGLNKIGWDFNEAIIASSREIVRRGANT